ncbi:MAG: RsmB/NOP family class I SAM-dependent RNA methyltransferase [Nanoarchaeota archaeon]
MPEKIPISDLHIKPVFEERYRKILGDRYEEYIDYSTSYIRKAIRVNTLKIDVKRLVSRLKTRWDLEQVPWAKEGFYIRFKGSDERYDIGNLPEHALGYIYVQDPASMIPPIVLSPKPGDKVLDMCAAPGSKTTQLVALMKNQGVIVANDINADRIKALGLNLQRCGVANTIITINRGMQLAHSGNTFDRVLVDAPCSGTGTIRRSLSSLNMWSPHLVRKFAKEQKHLIETGFSVLKKSGTLVYSTCTQEPEENEGVVSWLLEKYPDAKVEEIKLKIKRSKAITSWDGEDYHSSVEKCLRIYPQDNDTEGFFVAKIKKK